MVKTSDRYVICRVSSSRVLNFAETVLFQDSRNIRWFVSLLRLRVVCRRNFVAPSRAVVRLTRGFTSR